MNNITKILVAEDESIVALNIKKTLEKLGYQVTSLVSSGEDVIIKANNEHPDLILMDIMLKGSIDGIEAAGTIAQKNNIPVVFLTALSDEKTIDRAAFVKPYGYLVKPFTTSEMHTAIENALINFEENYREN
jgi:two-component system, response regulator PdtaR